MPATGAGLSAEARAQAVRELALAIQAIDEILKFIPAGDERPPRSAFFTSEGRQVFLAEPARFGRARLRAVRDSWKELVRGLAAEDTAP